MFLLGCHSCILILHTSKELSFILPWNVAHFDTGIWNIWEHHLLTGYNMVFILLSHDWVLVSSVIMHGYPYNGYSTLHLEWASWIWHPATGVLRLTSGNLIVATGYMQLGVANVSPWPPVLLSNSCVSVQCNEKDIYDRS